MSDKRKTGKGPREGYSRTSIDLPDDLHVRLKILAVRLGTDMRALAEKYITAGVQADEKASDKRK